MNAASLEPAWRRYRELFVEEMTKRFKLGGHPGTHVILCWKMNPSVDTTRSSALFTGKSAVFDLMEGEYMLKLKSRSIAIAAPAPPPHTPAGTTEPAATTAPADRPAGAATATPQPAAAKKRKLSCE